MSNALVAAGSTLNRLKTGTTSTNFGFASNHPTSALYDGNPGRPAIVSANVTDGHVTTDGNIISNGDFEAGATVWTKVGTGTFATGTAQSGSFGGSLTRGTDSYLYQDLTMQAGWEYNFTAAARRGATGTATGSIRVQNLSTGNYLTSSSTWTATPTDFLSDSDTTYTTVAATFTMESATVCQAAEPKVRVYLRVFAGAAGDAALFDNVFMWPSFDTFAVIGHNFGKDIAVTFRSSTDNFSGSNNNLTVSSPQSGITIYQPSFWGKTSTKSALRYSRLLFTGTTTLPPKIGEVVVTQSTQLSKMYSPNPEITEEESDEYSEGVGGAATSTLIAHWPRENAKVEFMAETKAQLDAVKWATFNAARGRTYPIMFVPADDEGAVILARLDPGWKMERSISTGASGTNVYSFALAFTGTGHYSNFV